MLTFLLELAVILAALAIGARAGGIGPGLWAPLAWPS